MSESAGQNVDSLNQKTHAVSVVVPIYSGGATLPALLAEIETLTEVVRTPDGNSFAVSEVCLLYTSDAADE